MNHRLRQSIYSLFSGEFRSSICKDISVNPRLTFFVEKCHINRPLVRGFKSNQQPLSSSSDKDDDDFFSELGPTVDEFTELGSPPVQSTGAPLKLLTEKPENLMRNGSPIFKNILSDLSKGKSVPASSPKVDIDKHGNASGCGAINKKDSNSKIPIYIRIENVPSTLSLPQLIKAISKYGNASSASMKTLSNGVICCYVKFEDNESWRRAIIEGSIAVGTGRLPMSLVCEKNSVMFKIKSIRKDTETGEIQSICNKLGKLEYLDRISKNVAYAGFTSKEESETQSILAKLNSVSFENCQWIAELQLPEYLKDDVDEYNELKSKMCNVLHEVRNEASLKIIDAKDLLDLHSSIMAVEDQFQLQTSCS